MSLFIGIDPGLSHIGMVELCESNMIVPRKTESVEDLAAQLYCSCEQEADAVIACEDVAWSAFSGSHGNGSARILECVGAARAIAAILRLEFVLVQPRSWRSFCGIPKGRKPNRDDLDRLGLTSWTKPNQHQRDAACIAFYARSKAR